MGRGRLRDKARGEKKIVLEGDAQKKCAEFENKFTKRKKKKKSTSHLVSRIVKDREVPA